MDRRAVLGRAQQAAQRGMVDQCVIRRPTGAETTDGDGYVTPEYVSPDPYTGRCRVQQDKASSAQHDVGEDNVVLLTVEVQLPLSVTGLQVGDEIRMTASVNDPDLVDRVFVLRSLAHKTDASCRRVQCTERTA